MIIALLKGGLGNQLYQYASAKALAEKNKTSIWLDLSFLNQNTLNITKRSFELHRFSLIESKDVKVIDHSNLKLPRKIIQKVSVKALRKIILEYVEDGNHFNADFFRSNRSVAIDGYFQSYKYFDFLRHQLFQDFQLIEPLDDRNLEALGSVLRCNSVCIHVRRGDYVSLGAANKFHGLCDLNYYRKAITIIHSKIENPHFFIFSDDIPWCRSHFNETNISFVSINNSDNAHLDLNLMKNCKHFVIANSSFSWWGAWLAENKNKIVIAPKKWLAAEDSEIEDRIPPEWICI